MLRTYQKNIDLNDSQNEDYLQLQYRDAQQGSNEQHTNKNIGIIYKNQMSTANNNFSQKTPRASYSNAYTNRKQVQKGRKQKQRSKSKTPLKNATMNKTISTSYLQKHIMRKSKSRVSPYQYEPANFELINTPQYFYQGQFFQRSKNGEGIMFTRKGLFIAGKWRKSYLKGRAFVQFPFGALGSLGFKAGRLNGWSLVLYQDRILVITLYFQDKIEGQRIIFDGSEQLWVSSKYNQKDGMKFQLAKITHVQSGRINTLPSFVDNMDLQFLLERFLQDYCFSLCQFNQISLLHISKDITFVGYLESEDQRPSKGYALANKSQKIKSSSLGAIISQKDSYVGVFQQSGILDGYGRIICPNGDIYQGQLKNGLFQGFGYFYQTDGNATLIGEFESNEFTNIFQSCRGYVAVDIEPSFTNKSEEHFQNEYTKKSQKWKHIKFNENQDFIGFYTSFSHDKTSKVKNSISNSNNMKSFQVSGNVTARTAALQKNITLQTFQNSSYNFGLPELAEFIEKYYYCYYVQRNKNQLNELSMEQNRQFDVQTQEIGIINENKNQHRHNVGSPRNKIQRKKSKQVNQSNKKQKKQKKQLWLNDDKGVSLGQSEKSNISDKQIYGDIMDEDSLNFLNQKIRKQEKCSTFSKVQKQTSSQHVHVYKDDDQQLPGLQKIYSLPKKQVIQRKRQLQKKQLVPLNKFETKNFNSIALKQNTYNQEMQTFDKHLPSESKKTEFMVMKKIPSKQTQKQRQRQSQGQKQMQRQRQRQRQRQTQKQMQRQKQKQKQEKSNASRSLQIDQMTFRVNQSLSKKDMHRKIKEWQRNQNPRMEIKNTNKDQKMDYSNFAKAVDRSEQKSQISNLSKKVTGMLERAKSKRKRIFE